MEPKSCRSGPAVREADRYEDVTRLFAAERAPMVRLAGLLVGSPAIATARVPFTALHLRVVPPVVGTALERGPAPGREGSAALAATSATTDGGASGAGAVGGGVGWGSGVGGRVCRHARSRDV